jgi:drug/metabolite transporter (DMT)-like permease
MKKPVFIVLGILLALVGVFWTLQGANVFNQSGGMNGKHTFIYIGIVVAIVGLVLLVTGLRSRRGTPAG